MTLRKKNPITNFENPSLVDDNFDDLYSNKLESRIHHNSSTVVFPFQSIESGSTTVSATGSPTVSVVVNLNEKYENILYAGCNIESSQLVGNVTDITSSQITLTAMTINSLTATTANVNFSSITTNSIIIRWLFLGSNP